MEVHWTLEGSHGHKSFELQSKHNVQNDTWDLLLVCTWSQYFYTEFDAGTPFKGLCMSSCNIIIRYLIWVKAFAAETYLVCLK